MAISSHAQGPLSKGSELEAGEDGMTTPRKRRRLKKRLNGKLKTLRWMIQMKRTIEEVLQLGDDHAKRKEEEEEEMETLETVTKKVMARVMDPRKSLLPPVWLIPLRQDPV